MKRWYVLAPLAAVAVVGVILALAIVPRASASPAQGGPGCVDGGKGYVGVIPGSGGESLNWHGTYIISLCSGATGPQAGDSDVQTITYANGTYEHYKIVYSKADLTSSGVFCYWDLTIDPSESGTGYHCPNGANQGDLYWYIVSSSGNSPYLEPANSGGWQSRPNGLGVYK